MPDGVSESSMTLWVLCEEHGEKDAHRYATGVKVLGIPQYASCPGGRVATIEDLAEALGGEPVKWCEEHLTGSANQFEAEQWICPAWALLEGKTTECRMVERILIPALDQEKQ